MRIQDINKMTERLLFPIKADGEVIGHITFFWRPAAITRRTLPNFIACTDEPLARAQERVRAAHAVQMQQGRQLPPLTKELLDEQIASRRDQLFEAEVGALEIAAERLMILLDPIRPTDITDENGEPIPPTWEGLADCLSVQIINSATERILAVMQAPLPI